MTTAPAPVRAAMRAALNAGVAALRQALKDAGGEVDAYAALLSGYVDDALAGRMDKVDLTRAHRELIREYAREVYVAALDDAGVPEEDMEQEDDDAIAAWVADQLGYVGDFATAVIAARGTDNASETMQGRVDAWVASLRALAGVATLSAKRNMTLVWRYGDTDHCDTCEKLNGERHRAKWFTDRGYIPQEPGSGTLDCGGWRCKCVLEDAEGNQVIP